jgi:hypothetical protein
MSGALSRWQECQKPGGLGIMALLLISGRKPLDCKGIEDGQVQGHLAILKFEKTDCQRVWPRVTWQPVLAICCLG